MFNGRDQPVADGSARRQRYIAASLLRPGVHGYMRFSEKQCCADPLRGELVRDRIDDVKPGLFGDPRQRPLDGIQPVQRFRRGVLYSEGKGLIRDHVRDITSSASSRCNGERPRIRAAGRCRPALVARKSLLASRIRPIAEPPAGGARSRPPGWEGVAVPVLVCVQDEIVRMGHFEPDGFESGGFVYQCGLADGPAVVHLGQDPRRLANRSALGYVDRHLACDGGVRPTAEAI